MRSLFGARNALRQILPTQATAQVFREVRTEDELRVALQPGDVTTLDALLANTGRRIVITAPITLHSPIIIPETMPGTIIESHGFIPLSAGVDGIDAFVIRAPLVIIRDVLLYADLTNNRRYNRAFVMNGGAVVAGTSVDPTSARIINVEALGVNQFLVDETTNDAGDGWIDRCSMQRFANDVNADGISLNSADWRITNSKMRGVGTGIALRVGSSGSRTLIMGNYFGGDGVDTSASIGGANVISSNVDAGTIVNTATDRVGLNS